MDTDTAISLGTIVVVLLLFFGLAAAVLIPLFAGLAIRTIWRKFSAGRL